jgi:hypothetical protein
MESLAAVGLASNILQFVDFTSRLLKTAKELKSNASSAENRDHVATVTHLKEIARDLSSCKKAIADHAAINSREQQVGLPAMHSKLHRNLKLT